MGRITNAIDALRGRTRTRQVVQEQTASRYYTNARMSNYENMFSQVRPLIDEMKVVRPYGVGRNGAALPLSRTPELAALLNPNESMGWLEFADAMYATWLTEPALYVHVHLSPRRKVLGYSILPPDSKKTLGEDEYWEITKTNGTIERFSEDEVMTLRYSRNPLNLESGVSPTSSVYVWAQIDDLIAQYQRAFFENGAVPATITFITASSYDRYSEKRRELENGLKGAKNRNKTIYAWRQLLDDNTTGDEIEVKTIQGNNSTMAIKDIVEIVNDRLNKSLGVSNFILGDDSSAKYDNAELSDHQFTRRRVYPALMTFWSTFQHELDRITGGIGYAIDFHLEIPELTDRLKTKAEIASITANNLISLLEAGATPSAAIMALGLPRDTWQPVADAIWNQRQKEQALTQAAAAIAQAVTAGQDSYKALHSATKSIDAAPTFTDEEKAEQIIYERLQRLKAKLATDEPVDGDEEDEWLEETTEAITQEVVKKSEDGALAGAIALLALGTARLGDYGQQLQQQVDEGKVELPAEFYSSLNDRVRSIVNRYAADIKGEVAKALQEFHSGAINKNELSERLKNIMPDARADMIARNEAHYAENAGRLMEDRAAALNTGVEIYLVWHARHDRQTCEVCAAMDGMKVKAGEAFPDHSWNEDGAQVSWDPSVYNDYGAIPNAHPNCRCWFEEVYGKETA